MKNATKKMVMKTLIGIEKMVFGYAFSGQIKDALRNSN